MSDGDPIYTYAAGLRVMVQSGASAIENFRRRWDTSLQQKTGMPHPDLSPPLSTEEVGTLVDALSNLSPQDRSPLPSRRTLWRPRPQYCETPHDTHDRPVSARWA